MRYLTEAEAWEVVAQIFEWEEAPQSRYGMCRVVKTMWYADLISSATRLQMSKRIYKRLDSGYLTFAPYRAGRDPLRVRIARQFARAAAAVLVICWLYPALGWVCVA